MAGGLGESRWAHAEPLHRPRRSRGHYRRSDPSAQEYPLQSHQSSIRSPDEEFARFFKIVERLNWKLPFLTQGYGKAIDTRNKEPHEIQNGEIQFKLDFHEFYMLLERAFVRLMAVFGIEPTRDGIVVGGNIMAEYPQVGLSRHQYHSNVLRALGDPINPLSKIFETPEVKRQLSRAKDLRNRWKNVDDVDFGKFQPAPLSTYNLDHMVTTILDAIEEAHKIALEHLKQDVGDPMKDFDELGRENNWAFFQDAMDWEAV
ncbi:hypothetical protein F5Y04DRAFT_262538 [Hypomontagnella monticulosa]|nr:hypothetical protein F5Y04DRAFT_262538 [Hypomontagnella monticulosa]